MVTNCYFEEKVKCKGGVAEMNIELGSSSFYEEHSVYLSINDKSLVMDLETAEKFMNAAGELKHYFDRFKDRIT